jgi:hypothetical protein
VHRRFTTGVQCTTTKGSPPTEASSAASKLSRVARFDQVKLVQKLVQKCIIQSPESGNYRKRSRLRLIARACLLSRRTIDHYLRQSFLSLSRPSQQITASTNARDTSHRGRTDQSHRQYHLSLPRPSQQTTDTTTPGDTSHRCRTDAVHSQDLL